MPIDILEKYGIDTLDVYCDSWIKAGFTAEQAKIKYYQGFLNITEQAITGIIEGVYSIDDLKEELKWREFAREEIAKIEGKPYNPSGGGVVTYDELAAAIKEGVNSYGE